MVKNLRVVVKMEQVRGPSCVMVVKINSCIGRLIESILISCQD